jgi:predicted RNA-binding protein with PUA-like domain
MVDIQYESSLPQPLSLEMLRQIPSLESMELLRKGSRLSVQPVTKQQFDTIIHFALPNT